MVRNCYIFNCIYFQLHIFSTAYIFNCIYFQLHLFSTAYICAHEFEYTQYTCMTLTNLYGSILYVLKKHLPTIVVFSTLLYPLTPDPIRVQSCVCCLFWTNKNSMAVISFYLSHSHYPIRDINPSISAISKWKYLLLLKPSFHCMPDSQGNLYALTWALMRKIFFF